VIQGDKLVVGDLGVDYETASVFVVTITSVDNGVPPLNITVSYN
jgi:hypothetical protein